MGKGEDERVERRASEMGPSSEQRSGGSRALVVGVVAVVVVAVGWNSVIMLVVRER